MRRPLLALVLLALAGGAGADAAPPTGNGLIAYGRFVAPGPTEVWVVAPDGSAKRRIDAGSQPAWSPDGTQLAYVGRGDAGAPPSLVVRSLDGSLRRVVAAMASTPAWSPDGTRIAFARQGRDPREQHVFVVGADGAGLVQLTSGAVRDSTPGWSPDGATIAFERNGAIWAMNADGSGQRPLLGRAPGEQAPRFSPDGSRLAFAREGVVYTVNADGSGPERRVSPEGLWSGGPAWSPDGTRIAFDAGGAVCTARAEGGDARRLTWDGVGETTWSSYTTPVSWQPVAGPSGPDSPYSCGDPRWDMAVRIAANRRRASVGDAVTYRILVRNLGPDPSTATNFGVGVPEESRAVAVSTLRGECQVTPNGSFTHLYVSCSPGVLFPGESASVTVTVQLLAPGPLRATAAMAIFAPHRDVNARNDTATVTVPVAGCTITGTYGADVLRGTARRDVICGLGGEDTIRALAGDDVIWAGGGDDVGEGGAGRDRLLGGSGRDDLDGGDGADVVWGGLGKDVLWGGAGDDALHGDAGGRVLDSAPYWQEGDRLYGAAGKDVLEGGVGSDGLRAGPGDDVVLARDGGGADFASCGDGVDRLVADRRDRERDCERIARG